MNEPIGRAGSRDGQGCGLMKGAEPQAALAAVGDGPIGRGRAWMGAWLRVSGRAKGWLWANRKQRDSMGAWPRLKDEAAG